MPGSSRGCYGFASNTRVKLSYNHFDSYPEVLGKEIVTFIQKVNAEDGWGKMRVAVDAVTIVTDGQVMTEPEARYYIPKKKSFPKLPTWYEALHSHMGGKILGEIYDGTVKHMCGNVDFPKDSHFCDFAYIIDLNSMTFDVYIGQQKNPDPNSYFGQQKNEAGFFPCKFVATWPLHAIPADWETQVNQMVKENAKGLKKAA